MFVVTYLLPGSSVSLFNQMLYSRNNFSTNKNLYEISRILRTVREAINSKNITGNDAKVVLEIL